MCVEDFIFSRSHSGPSRTMVFWLRGKAVYCTLYNALLEKLSTTGDENIMEKVANFYVFDKLKDRPPRRSAVQPAPQNDDPYSLGLRVENLLSVTSTQRTHQIARLASRHDPRAETPHELVFNCDDMKETMNTWRNNPSTWMDGKSLEFVKTMKNNPAYHLALRKKSEQCFSNSLVTKAL